MNRNAELLSGLSDIPLLLCGVIMAAAAARSNGKGEIRKNWLMISVLLCFTALLGVFVHAVKIKDDALRLIWPFVYLVITELVRRFWLQMIRIIKGKETEKRYRKLITVFAFMTAAVNGLLEIFFGADLAPLFLVFAVPAVLSILWMVFSDNSRTGDRNRRSIAYGMLLMLMSTLADGIIRRPVIILGVPCSGALFGHVLMLAALVVFISVVIRTSQEDQ